MQIWSTVAYRQERWSFRPYQSLLASSNMSGVLTVHSCGFLAIIITTIFQFRRVHLLDGFKLIVKSWWDQIRLTLTHTVLIVINNPGRNLIVAVLTVVKTVGKNRRHRLLIRYESSRGPTVVIRGSATSRRVFWTEWLGISVWLNTGLGWRWLWWRLVKKSRSFSVVQICHVDELPRAVQRALRTEGRCRIVREHRIWWWQIVEIPLITQRYRHVILS